MKNLFMLAVALVVMTLAPAYSEPIVSGEIGQKVDSVLSAEVGANVSGIVFVAKGDEILILKGYGLADHEAKIPATPDTVFDIGSITKQFTASGILRLEMEGKLAVTDPITKYFDGVPPDKQAITLHHLLTHTAGLTDILGGDYAPMERDDLVKQAMTKELIHGVGEKYEYSNLGYSLLAAILEKASGKGYEQYLHDTFFGPLGMTKTGYVLPKFTPDEVATGYTKDTRWGKPTEKVWAPDGPYWNLRGNGGILSTVGDMYIWHRALLSDKVLSDAAREKMFAPHADEGGGRSFYGYGFMSATTARGTKLIAHNGGNNYFFADFRRYVDDGIVIIEMTNNNRTFTPKVRNGILVAVFGPPPATP